MSEVKIQNKAQEHQGLIKSIQAGDESAKRHFVKKYGPYVQRFIISKTRADNIEWEDIFQDVFLAALQNFSKEDFELTSDVRSYLFRIAYNKIAKQIKEKIKNRTNTSLFDDPTTILIVEVMEELGGEKDRREKWLHQCMKLLKPQHRRVLELKYYEGKKGWEIQEIMALESTTKVHELAYFGRKRLRECIELKQK